MAGGSVTFSTKLDNKTLEQELSRLGKKILRLEDDLNTKKLKRNALVESLKQAREELAKLQGQTTMVGGKFQISPEAVSRITELQEKIPQMEADAKKYDDALEDVNQTLEATAQRYGDINAELQRRNELQETLGDDGGNDEPEQQLSKMEQARAIVQETMQEVKDGLVGLRVMTTTGLDRQKVEAETYKDSIKALNEELDSLLRKQKELNGYGLGLGLGKEKRAEIAAELSETNQRIDEIKRKLAEMASNSERAGDGLRESAENASELADATNRADGFLDKFTKRISGLLKRVFIFSLITTALRSARTWMGKAIKTNSEATASIARLKGALLTLAQPLLEVVIPAFTMLVNVLTAIIGAIAQFISLLTGKSVKQTAASAKALYDEQSALEGVGSAAEEAKGSLAGFDEINTIQTEGTGGGGGAGASANEIVPDFSWMDGITERLKEIADLVMLIGLGFALWKIGSMLPGVLGQIATYLGLILMFIGGILLYWNGLTDAWENGVDWLNLIEMVGGLALAVFALYQLLGPVAAGILLLVGSIGMLVTAFHDAMENGWNLQNTLLAIAGIVGTGLALTFLTGSIIPLVIAGIAALLLAFTVATGHGEELLDGIRTVMEGFVDFFTGIFSGDIEKAIGGIEKIFDGLGVAAGAVIDGIRDTFLSFLNWLDKKTGGKLHGIIEFVKGLVTGLFDSIKKYVLDSMEALKKIFTGLTQFISGVFTGDWDKAWEGVKNIFKGTWSSIASFLEAAVNLIIDGVNGLIRMLNKVSFSLPDWVPAIGGKSFGFNIQPLDKVSIPRLAQGAVIPPNREFLAVLGDQKSGTNVEAPEELIRKIVREETGGNSEVVALLQQLLAATKAGRVMYVDRKVLARSAADGINDMTRQAGKPVLLL